eukprot:NODE_3888_length_718_cov_180.850523_g3281_i0.p1 GENE.NODE_3888_length_718_cov_180.850523_g3281_i0~~NODE_3888_length_718_cov_180.850523_g3281_i0.p1  ORF type:complete len:101 (+),score=20.35 NODE_3888_length_718_cov_180.850523_g3281_i0:343-645(+)
MYAALIPTQSTWERWRENLYLIREITMGKQAGKKVVDIGHMDDEKRSFPQCKSPCLVPDYFKKNGYGDDWLKDLTGGNRMKPPTGIPPSPKAIPKLSLKK